MLKLFSSDAQYEAVARLRFGPPTRATTCTYRRTCRLTQRLGDAVMVWPPRGRLGDERAIHRQPAAVERKYGRLIEGGEGLSWATSSEARADEGASSSWSLSLVP